jgi:hypothetical protein
MFVIRYDRAAAPLVSADMLGLHGTSMISQFTSRRRWLLAAGIVLLFGSIAAGLIAVRANRARAWIREIEQGHDLLQAADSSYRENRNIEAKQALSTYLSYLEATAPSVDSWKAGHHPWLDARGLAFEKMLVAGRLAIVEERQGDSTEAALSWARAEDFARAAQTTGTERRAILTTIERLDAQASRQPR